MVPAGALPRVIVEAGRPPAEPSIEPALDGGSDQFSTRCRHCGAIPPSRLWFCASCGQQMRPTPPPIPSRGDPDRVDPFLASVTTGERVDRQGFERAMRAGNAGRRVGYDRPPTAPTVMFRLTGGAVVLGALLFAILPSASSARLSFYYAVEGVFRSSYAPIPLESATTTPVSPPPSGFVPVGIASGRLVGPWVVPWAETGSASRSLGPCQSTSTATSGSLSIHFRSPVSIDRFEILAGLDHTNDRWASFARPATVDLLFSNGSCQRIPLADQYTDQQFAVHVARVTGVTIHVVSSYPPETSDAKLLAISSVSFMHRR